MKTIQYENNNSCLFDLAQGIYLERKWLRKIKKVRGYTAICRKFSYFTAFFFILAIFFCIFGWSILFEITIWCFGVSLWIFLLLKFCYKKALKQYLKSNDPSGKIILDDVGIKEVNARGGEIKFLWLDYEACVVTEDVIVFLFKPTIPFLLFIPYKDKSYQVILDFMIHKRLENTMISVSSRR